MCNYWCVIESVKWFGLFLRWAMWPLGPMLLFKTQSTSLIAIAVLLHQGQPCLPFWVWNCLYHTPNSLHFSELTRLEYFQLAILEIADWKHLGFLQEINFYKIFINLKFYPTYSFQGKWLKWGYIPALKDTVWQVLIGSSL